MLTAANTATVELFYKDNEREARVTLRFPFGLSTGSIIAASESLQSAIASISDAVLVRREIRWKWYEDNPPEATGTAPSQSYLALFYRNEGEYDAVYLPAPKEELWKASGAYAGVVLDTDNPAVAALVDDFNVALAAAAGPVFPFVGASFVVGGRAL